MIGFRDVFQGLWVAVLRHNIILSLEFSVLGLRFWF